MIDTSAPKVKLEALTPALSNNATPTFKGTASDPSEPVTVSIYKGSRPERDRRSRPRPER